MPVADPRLGPRPVPAGAWAAAGCALILLGLAANEWLLALAFSADGELATRNRWLVRATQLVLLLAGASVVSLRRRIRVPMAGAAAGAVAILLSPVVAELSVRAFFAARNRVRSPARHTEQRLGWQTEAHQHVSGYHRGYGHVSYTTSRHGFRVFGDPGRDGFRVLVLGDSSTEASQVSDGETYYEVMASLCPEAEVFGYGAGGYGSLQEYLVLDAFLDVIDPQLILWQFDGNDLVNNSLEWESASRRNNNLMTRPYLIDCEIELAYPVQRGSGAVTELLQRSHLARLLRVTGQRFAVGEEPAIGPGDPVFEQAVAITDRIMAMVQRRVGDRPVAAFCIYPGPGNENGARYREICRRHGIHFLDDAMEPVLAARAAGETVTGVESGIEVDSHLNARGHRLLGAALVRALAGLGLLPCQPSSDGSAGDRAVRAGGSAAPAREALVEADHLRPDL